ncbi:hypothetical protein Pla52o_37970 [Novipirellula galeiformis]|uniref:Uncharacterized protein n=1 Tax=Novipirellula galeiformis TaxID=2528004 RepID=A0A5C6CAK2_9BACT|nr:hypothetical protein Pla52o_37970 [Novipirellula galeiformis]
MVPGDDERVSRCTLGAHQGNDSTRHPLDVLPTRLADAFATICLLGLWRLAYNGKSSSAALSAYSGMWR